MFRVYPRAIHKRRREADTPVPSRDLADWLGGLYVDDHGRHCAHVPLRGCVVHVLQRFVHRFHPDEYFWEIRFVNENYYTRATSGHVPERMCNNFRCKSEQRSPKWYFPETVTAMRLYNVFHQGLETWSVQSASSGFEERATCTTVKDTVYASPTAGIC